LLRRVAWYIITDVSKDIIASTFRVKQYLKANIALSLLTDPDSYQNLRETESVTLKMAAVFLPKRRNILPFQGAGTQNGTTENQQPMWEPE
jgi:hypothetical protein